LYVYVICVTVYRKKEPLAVEDLRGKVSTSVTTVGYRRRDWRLQWCCWGLWVVTPCRLV